MIDYALIVIGASLGGLKALETLLSTLPKSFRTPIVVVQHRGAEASETLVRRLRHCTSLRVREPCDKESIEQGHVYVAPADYHLLVENGAFALSTAGPVQYARPSIDVLFESAADAYEEGLIGIVLTGANADGAHGAARIKAAGGIVIAQDPHTAECAIMPKAAIRATQTDHVLTLPKIGAYLAALQDAASESAPTRRRQRRNRMVL